MSILEQLADYQTQSRIYSTPSTLELDPANQYYGIASVVKRYSSLPQDRPLHGTWPHGIHYNDTYRREELSLPYSIAYSNVTERSARLLAARRTFAPKPFIIKHGLPIQMAALIIDEEKTTSTLIDSSILYFPSHSSLELSLDMSLEQTMLDLIHLREKFKTVSLSVFWKDVQLGTFEKLYAYCDHIYCAGSQYSPYFLYNLVHLLRSHQYYTGNSIGSYLWYGISIGASPYFDESLISRFSLATYMPLADRKSSITTQRILNDSFDCLTVKVRKTAAKIVESNYDPSIYTKRLVDEISAYSIMSAPLIRDLEFSAEAIYQSSMYPRIYKKLAYIKSILL